MNIYLYRLWPDAYNILLLSGNNNQHYKLFLQCNLSIKTIIGTPTKCGPYTQVVFICRFNHMESMVYTWGPVKCGLYIQVVFRAGLTKFSSYFILIN